MILLDRKISEPGKNKTVKLLPGSADFCGNCDLVGILEEVGNLDVTGLVFDGNMLPGLPTDNRDFVCGLTAGSELAADSCFTIYEGTSQTDTHAIEKRKSNI